MTSKKIVLGLGGTVDYEINWDQHLIDELIREYKIKPTELTRHAPIESERDLLCTLASYIADDVGGERFVTSSDIIEQFATRFNKQVTLGGTCVRAAIALDRMGLASTVHLVSIDDHVRQLLPSSIEIICSAAADSTDPHLIIQYPADTSICVDGKQYRTKQPNRIIYTNDPPNRELMISPALQSATAVANVFLVSGFNTIQNEEILNARLLSVIEAIDTIPDEGIVIYEDASYHLPEFAGLVRTRLLNQVDLWSMNEDELQHYLGRTIDLLEATAVSQALRDLRYLFPGPTLIVHTQHWVSVQADHPARWIPAIQCGITMSSTRYLHGDKWTTVDYEITNQQPRQPDAKHLANLLNKMDDDTLLIVPAFELSTEYPTTIGLGDAFASGLIKALSRKGHPDHANRTLSEPTS